MPIFGHLALVLALLLVCSFFPGFFFVRRMRWTPLEKLCASIGLSLILIYLAAWAIYCFGPREQRPAYWAVVAVSIGMGFFCRRDAWRLLRSFRIRQTLLAFAFLLAWTFAMLSVIRVYSGAGWAADWIEHFQRSLFFLDRMPPSTKILLEYLLPARPPMQNVLAAFFLGLTADRFEVFQAIFGFLNMAMFLPCVLLLPALGVNKRRRLIPLMVLFAANPAVMENVTYTWTKALTAFFVILGISLYLGGWRKNEPTRTAAAFLALAAGTLVHYSAGPYVIFIGLHYLVRLYRAKPRPWKEFAVAIAPAILLLATWFGWSLKVYGTRTTIASNTSVTYSAADPAQNLAKIGANVFDTIVPVWLRGDTPQWVQPNNAGVLRDQAFVFYQLNLIFAMGALGGPLVVWLVYRQLASGKQPASGKTGRSERLFWALLLPVCVVLGVAVVGERDPLGVPHLTLLALEVAGLTLLAAAFPRLGRPLRLALIAACCIDFSLGVLLQARVEALENTPGRAVFPELAYRGPGRFELTDPTVESLGAKGWRNWSLKHRTGMFQRWLRELPRGHEADPQFQAGWPKLEATLKSGLADDTTNWGGWGARNGGTTVYLGDWVAGSSGRGTDIATGVFLAMFAGCLWLMVRQSLVPAPPVAAVKPPPPRASVRRARR